MRERVTDVGGEFKIKSQPGKGTTVIAVIPCIAATKEQQT
jgi:signal transduction histidine kinase